ncbi:MAG: hypothetical protein K1X88_07465 [Nannocystaceae bacterium]|nr:hypothetical protein [Nannocystaceae bacterium]
MTRIVLLALWLSEPASRPEVPAEITDAAAREHFGLGMDAWLAEDYPRAQRELEAAYALDPAPVLLYSLGQLSRLQGDCVRARERFLAFLETDPPEAAAADTRTNLERCKVPEPVPEPEPEPALVELPPPAPPPRPPPRRRPDALGLSLTLGGGALAAIGAGLLGGAFAARRAANDAGALPRFDEGVQRSRGLYGAGFAVLGTGAALLVGGIVELAVSRRRERSRASARRAL